MPVGSVKWFNPKKGYGFISPEDGDKDAFVHITAVQGAGLDTLNEGDKVEYELVEGQNGKASAALLASLLHDNKLSISQIKTFLLKRGLVIRPNE